MTERIVTLPAIRTERNLKGLTRDMSGATIAIRISARDLSRLRAIAKGWGMELPEAAAAILSRALDPRKSHT